METEKYEIIYADPPWSYYNDMTVAPDCTTTKGMRRPNKETMCLLWELIQKKFGCEICLIATRGKNAHKLVINHKINSFIEYPRQEHSKKPDCIRAAIVELCGDRKRLELFSRCKIEDWDIWGNELANDIELKTIENE